MVADAEMCFPLTSKLRFQPELDASVDMIRSPFFTLTLQRANHSFIQRR